MRCSVTVHRERDDVVEVFIREIAGWWPQGDGTPPETVAWEPPVRVAMRRLDTAVEVRFIELGPELTRVELEHRGWAHLSRDPWAEVLQRLKGYGPASRTPENP